MSTREYFPLQLKGYPISEAVRVGDVVYLAGQLGIGENGLVEGFEAQSVQTMDNIGAALKRVGLGFEHVVKCTVMLDDVSKAGEFNRVYQTYFPAGQYPTRSAFGGCQLAFGAEVEVECIAIGPRAAG
ncbi:RidA family protein [Massilia sp. HP4]|uniref:RidA family protein n=1 Tax=Massilia sp. HP4 TaxID=2562316 RepID=UPI0010C03629|nr:RidA family protein [Massilia sp. HP4]